MNLSTVATVPALAALLLLAGCSGMATPEGVGPGAASASAPTGNSPDDHTTAATGFGLGPEDFKSNGGAFGPDQAN